MNKIEQTLNEWTCESTIELMNIRTSSLTNEYIKKNSMNEHVDKQSI